MLKLKPQLSQRIKDYPILGVLIFLGPIGLIIGVIMMRQEKLPTSFVVGERNVPTWFLIITFFLVGVLLVGIVLYMNPQWQIQSKTSVGDFMKSNCYNEIGYSPFRNFDEQVTAYSDCEMKKVKKEYGEMILVVTLQITLCFIILFIVQNKQKLQNFFRSRVTTDVPGSSVKMVNQETNTSSSTPPSTEHKQKMTVTDKMEALEKLQKLNESGLLSDEEFKRLKEEILR